MVNTPRYLRSNLNNLQLTILIPLFAMLIWDIGIPGFSIIPTMIIAFFAIILSFHSKKLSISRFDMTLMSYGCLCLVLSLVSFLFIPNADIFEALRMIRFFIALVSIWIICNAWNITMKDSFLIIIIVLLIHSIVLGLQIISYDFKVFSASFVGMNKQIFDLRGFGLTSAYDTAGAFLCIAILLIFSSKHWTSFFRYTLIIFLLAIGFSTGRTFMITGSAIVFLLMLYSLFSARGTKIEKYVVFQTIILMGLFFGFAYSIFGELWLVTADRFFLNDDMSNSRLYAGYYAGSINELGNIKAFNFSSNIQYLFGTGKTLGQIDIGFLKTLYTYGFITGPFMLLYVFILIFLAYKKFVKMNLRIVGLAFFMVFVIYNIKMQSFFSSGYSEILFLLLFAKESLDDKHRKVDRLKNSY